MQCDDRNARVRPEGTAPSRRPYEPPRLEVLELRPEEQLLQCAKIDNSPHSCRLGPRKHS